MNHTVSIRTRPEERVIHEVADMIQDGSFVSIRTRPEERVILLQMNKRSVHESEFQSAPAPKSG